MPTKPTLRRAIRLELLESRQLMAADISLTNGTLLLNGTDSADKAYVSYFGSNVKATINDRTASFAISKVQAILFRGYDDDDYFRNSTAIKTTAYGHDGDDYLSSGAGSDYLSGGNGNDTIYGGSGNDTIRGNAGNDYLSGNDGADSIYGHEGYDILYGGTGDDLMDGGDANDELYGNDGNDKMYGGIGNDLMYGGDGNDYMAGYLGNDTMYGQNGDDTVRGNDGDDRLFGGDGVDSIVGGNGNDALHGGGGTSPDKLWGEAGRDRFLTQTNDKIMDGSGLGSSNGDDVEIKFVNGNQSWSNDEIEVIDRGFARLFAARGANDLLRDPLTPDPLTFVQENLDAGVLGVNRLSSHVKGCTTSGPWYNQKTVCDYRTRYTRQIAFPEWDAGNATKNAEVVNTLFHEIGHNFDEVEFTKFKAISGWVQNPKSKIGLVQGKSFNTGKLDTEGWYRKSNSASDFAEGYGGTNPHEDFATVFEMYFRNNRSTYASDAQLKAKLAIVDTIVRNA